MIEFLLLAASSLSDNNFSLPLANSRFPLFCSFSFAMELNLKVRLLISD